MKSILLVSHGSHNPKTKQEIADLTQKIKSATQTKHVRFAFLEIESPSIPEGIKQCVEEGADEVLLLLNFLNSGRHVDEDIPAIVADEAKKYPQCTLSVSKPVGQHDGILKLFLDLIEMPYA